MKKQILKIILTMSMLFGAFIIPAKAGEVGVAFGVMGTAADFETTGAEHEGNATNTNPETETNSLTVSEDVEFGSLFLEGVVRGGLGGLTVGFEYVPGEAEIGAKSRTDTDGGDASGEADTGTYTGKAEISDHISLYLEPTLYPTENIGIYGKVGVSQVTVNSIESITQGTDNSAYGEEEIYGYSAGLGVRAVIGPGFLVKAEWLTTEYETVKLTSATGNKSTITADPESESFRIGFGWQF